MIAPPVCSTLVISARPERKTLPPETYPSLNFAPPVRAATVTVFLPLSRPPEAMVYEVLYALHKIDRGRICVKPPYSIVFRKIPLYVPYPVPVRMTTQRTALVLYEHVIISP